VATQGDLRGTIAALEKQDGDGRPLKPNRRVLLARLYLLSGEDDKARAAYDKALTDGSTVTEAKKDLAFLLAKQTKVDDETIERALTLAREAVAAMPDDAEALDTLGLVYLRQGDAKTALGQFTCDRGMQRRPSASFTRPWRRRVPPDRTSTITRA